MVREVEPLEGSCEAEALMNGIRALTRVRRVLASSLCPMPGEDTRRRQSAAQRKVLTRI